MLGQFLEISIATTDIAATVAFYERLGFSHCTTSDTWPHRYGVLTDGRVWLGLHEYRFDSPALTFWREHIVASVPQFAALGIEMAFVKSGGESFNEIGFGDPSGRMIAVLEARTFSRSERTATEYSACGYFSEFSQPCADFAACAAFWESLGFVAHDAVDRPFAQQVIASSAINIGLHHPAFSPKPLLVFRDSHMSDRVASLAERGVTGKTPLPGGLSGSANALLVAPEGTGLLLLQDDEF
ncbi:MAG: VOC family protein [Steroidobacteraceae bacterium]